MAQGAFVYGQMEEKKQFWFTALLLLHFALAGACILSSLLITSMETDQITAQQTSNG